MKDGTIDEHLELMLLGHETGEHVLSILVGPGNPQLLPGTLVFLPGSLDDLLERLLGWTLLATSRHLQLMESRGPGVNGRPCQRLASSISHDPLDGFAPRVMRMHHGRQREPDGKHLYANNFVGLMGGPAGQIWVREIHIA